MGEEISQSKPVSGLELWKNQLKEACYIVAPMVDQSELAWRMLTRRYGAQLCYTPMLHASVFVRDAHYRQESLHTCSEDRPLIVQFCANDPETLLKAASYVQHICDAVDLNLGCPQSIAKRGHYGAFLQDEWSLLFDMVSLCASKLTIPITCKVRIFDDIQRTVDYARMLEQAGTQLLTVHGRTREQKGPNTGIASWRHIKAVRDSVNIPIFANGNIQYFEDINRCLQETGAHGVMSAEGILHNPALFSGRQPSALDMADEYLELVDKYPCPLSYVRGHLFKLLHCILLVHSEFRDILGNCRTVTQMKDIIQLIKEKCPVNSDESSGYGGYDAESVFLPLPYWICQPYVRPDPTVVGNEVYGHEKNKRSLDIINNSNDSSMSRNKLKKLRRNCNKCFEPKPNRFPKCGNVSCGNPKGQKCVFDQCKQCCRLSVVRQSISCPGHHIFAKRELDLAAADHVTVICHRVQQTVDEDAQQIENGTLNAGNCSLSYNAATNVDCRSDCNDNNAVVDSSNKTSTNCRTAF